MLATVPSLFRKRSKDPISHNDSATGSFSMKKEMLNCFTGKDTENLQETTSFRILFGYFICGDFHKNIIQILILQEMHQLEILVLSTFQIVFYMTFLVHNQIYSWTCLVYRNGKIIKERDSDCCKIETFTRNLGVHFKIFSIFDFILTLVFHYFWRHIGLSAHLIWTSSFVKKL